MIVLVTGFSNAFRLEIPEKISGNYQVIGYDNTIIATISANNQTNNQRLCWKKLRLCFVFCRYSSQVDLR